MQLVLRTWAILWKDILIELRTKQSFSAMIFFAALVLFLFAFAIGPDTATLSRLEWMQMRWRGWFGTLRCKNTHGCRWSTASAS